MKSLYRFRQPSTRLARIAILVTWSARYQHAQAQACYAERRGSREQGETAPVGAATGSTAKAQSTQRKWEVIDK